VEPEQHEVGTGVGAAEAERLLDGQRRVHRPGRLCGLHRTASERFEEEATPDEQCARWEQPERDGVDPRERHVVRSDQKRDEVVREGCDDRRPEEEQHRDAVTRQDRVVEVVAEQCALGCDELEADPDGHQATDDEGDDGVQAVQHPDVLVVDSREPADQSRRLLFVCDSGLAAVDATARQGRVRPPVLATPQ
jgi:hypothetical protein